MSKLTWANKQNKTKQLFHDGTKPVNDKWSKPHVLAKLTLGLMLDVVEHDE